MRLTLRILLLLLACVLCASEPLRAQLPFYTDDPAVTDRGKWHFEFFNEYDALQLQYPNLRQNTANFKLNYGLLHNLELDVDAPYLAIDRAAENKPSSGVGDTNMGIKWNFHKESGGSRLPALGASLYVSDRRRQPSPVCRAPTSQPLSNVCRAPPWFRRRARPLAQGIT
jgi:hypothetical protein